MWYVKMYFSEKRELFQCDASGIQGVPSVDREFPFLESLLTFLEMDCGELTPILQRIADRWGRLITEFDRDAGMCVGMTVSPEWGSMVTGEARRMSRC